MIGTEDGFDSTSLLSGWVNNNKTPSLNLTTQNKIKNRFPVFCDENSLLLL